MKAFGNIYNSYDLRSDFLDILEGKNGISLFRAMKKENKLSYYYLEQQLHFMSNNNSCMENYTEYQESNIPQSIKLSNQKSNDKIEVEHYLIDLSIYNRTEKLDVLRSGRSLSWHRSKSLAQWLYDINHKFGNDIENHQKIR